MRVVRMKGRRLLIVATNEVKKKTRQKDDIHLKFRNFVSTYLLVKLHSTIQSKYLT